MSKAQKGHNFMPGPPTETLILVTKSPAELPSATPNQALIFTLTAFLTLCGAASLWLPPLQSWASKPTSVSSGVWKTPT